jgi:hypothetical protein
MVIMKRRNAPLAAPESSIWTDTPSDDADDAPLRRRRRRVMTRAHQIPDLAAKPMTGAHHQSASAIAWMRRAHQISECRES